WNVTRWTDTCTVKTDSSPLAAAGSRGPVSLDLSQNYHPLVSDCTGAQIDPLNPSKGDTVVLEATPTDNDSSPATGTLKSNNVTIVNSAPVVDSASIDQSSPKTNDLLTTTVTNHDDDAATVTLAYQWQKSTDGGATCSDLLGRTPTRRASALTPSRGDTVVLEATPTDNDSSPATGTLKSNNVTIVNSAPVVDSASIDQSS